MGEFDLQFGISRLWWPISLSAAGALGALTWWGYYRRRAEVATGLKWLFQLLRGACYILILLCLLQPFLREYVREERAARLTVLVDDSESMSFTDGPKQPSRTARVQEALQGKGGLLAKLEKSFQVGQEAFSGSARPVDSFEQLTGQGDRTDLAKSLGDAFTRLRGAGAAGLILISDGADTTRGNWARAAQAYRRAGLPIYTVGVGADDVPDLAISQVRCRRLIGQDTLARVEVEVTRTGLPPGPRTVRVLRKGNVIKEAVADLSGEKGTATLEFFPGEQGFLEYEAVVEPDPAELVLTNNTFAFGLMSFSRKLRVLYMEGTNHQHRFYGRYTWGDKWEHQFLKEALEEDRDVEVDVLLGDLEGVPPGDLKTVKEGYPRTKKEMYAYDVIMDSDIPFGDFTPDQVRWTVDFTARHGGGFIMIGGWHAFGEGGYAKTPFDRMLPVEMNAGDTHADNRDFRWVVTDEGWTHPLMQIEKDPAKNKEVWDKLNTLGGTTYAPAPSFHGYSKTTRPKPAATVLATIDEETEPGSAYGPMTVVAVQPFGRGRSMAFTTDTTGGWGTEWEDSWGDDQYDPARRNIYFKQFWKNAIRWLAHYRLQAPNQLVVLETERLVYGRGELPEVRVRVLTDDYEPTHDAQVTLAVSGPSGSREELTLYPRYEEPGVYERKIECPAVGRYELEARAVLRGDELGRDKCLLQVRPATEELRRLSQDVDTLKKIAAESGGEYFPLDKVSRLPDLLRQDMHVIQRHRDVDLWDRGWILSVLIALLCIEWFWRKRAGLP